MLYWSKYNKLFQNSRFGFFLYNSLSNSFFELDKSHYQFLTQLEQNPNCASIDSEYTFLNLLREKKVLIGKGENGKAITVKQYNRNKFSYDTSNLILSICPTLGCNFRCPYCFENDQHVVKKMGEEVINQIISFIKSFKKAKDLSICWYGGEPTMVFDIIKKITEKVKKLDITYKEASIITNGYLLNEEKVNELNDLNIKSVQVTIDGLKDAHNSRRFLTGGRPTYDKILTNIEKLMNSTYNGSCSIRVNIDRSNLTGYLKLREHLLNKFKGKKVTVYSGRVETFGNSSCNSCNLNANEWTDFTIDLFHNNGISPGEHVYPDSNIENLCSANTQNSFVIGQDGELYKCWEDVGRKDMVVGDIFEVEPITNMELVSLYDVGTNPYLDQECLSCTFLPICGGGCANRRLRAKHYNEKGMEFCSLYKDNIVKYLMEYYDDFITKELCNAFTNDNVNNHSKGYRLISPTDKKEKSTNAQQRTELKTKQKR